METDGAPEAKPVPPARQERVAGTVRSSLSRRRRAPDRQGPLANLPRRALLTLRHHGWREFILRVVTFPLRPTPLGRRLGYGARFGPDQARARGWYRSDGRPVTVVIPTYGDPAPVEAAVAGVRRTTDRRRVRILVVDDASAPHHQARLQRLTGAEVLLGERNLGFAGNVNRGLRAADGDVVLINSDVIVHPGWLECLQSMAHWDEHNGIVGGKLLYPDGRIQSAGSFRPPAAPEWFDHRYRFRPADYGPANVAAAALAVTGACMYIREDVIERIGLLDERFGMAYEDVDYCLRAWEAGYRVIYHHAAVATHAESVTRGTEQAERELTSQRRFWEKWGDWFDRRAVHTDSGRLRVIYVTEDTGVGGGHRDVFEHLNRLQERGHAVELYSLAGAPDWFPLRAPVRTFEDYGELIDELASQDAIKVATWWNTAVPVWTASVVRGIPAYFVQDIETSYYDERHMHDAVIASYREEFAYMTISEWNRERLAELGREAELIPPGLDLSTFRPLGEPRRERMVLALGRSNPLKNLDLTIAAWNGLPSGTADLWLFGAEPELGARAGARYFDSPDDEQVNELFNQASVFVQTSRHEGFCLPALEAMATGAAVVCTDAHGNRDFCRDGENCLMPEASRTAVAAAIKRLLDDPDLRSRLGEAGIETAADYAWERRIDALEAFLLGLASSEGPAASLVEKAPSAE